ncbi:hypothetical protein A2V56_04100 [Candidatus Woesebacteria bacterium RBG_19FT_COMBO_42_9]|uniref:Nucleotidyl transferase AbiEii/AbiGii toxin family protein n=1 Tax=Candidatus Woesebacteria bacterium RBG_16_42_24 TaxID=1802485 RepID=A0A1F7XJQ2_9BACT|nr:MAG: hypothetical protein A2V97_01265 [Candidatus Woesebacteria bacterium RBG_16_42_24]OGM17802.1 MAG: hypothetical protein A2V56_04100 [Candidatus Woesebacteria bacterium RBG_19FT_COMBO_42_9]OGM68078.1 MAG: hypothetical protein A2985_03340 [Candidatus Woesebacteria bacterium RIFCSPLOWO2_01_FULL_43_11]
MHEEVLSEGQRLLLPIITKFSDKFGLVGGTAMALQIGHRRSVDFDLASLEAINNEKIANSIRGLHPIESTLVDEMNELTVVVASVKLTFLKFPFTIEFRERLGEFINMPDILTLASMKAYSLGRRAKWKDYVDLFFAFKKHTINEVINKAREIFKKEFNEKLFREQLSYFDDLDYSERIDYLSGHKKDDSEIKEFLAEISLQK